MQDLCFDFAKIGGKIRNFCKKHKKSLFFLRTICYNYFVYLLRKIPIVSRRKLEL